MPILTPDDAMEILEMNLEDELAQKLDELVPPSSAVADSHNTSSWMKLKLEAFNKV